MLEERVLQELKELVIPEEKIVVGVSGGPDSMCLLDILRRLKYNVVVAHVNHLIRKDAIDDEKYVKEYCEKWGIQIYVKQVNVTEIASLEKLGIEETGRKVRYEFYEEVLKKENASKIATAHNKNDFAETIIMNILRGSGINGIKSIEKMREGKYIKPLLAIERSEIELYCEQHSLQPRIDSTNSDNAYTRNKIRNIVMPYIKQEFNPNIVQTLTRMAEIVSVEQDYIENQTKIEFNRIKKDNLLNNDGIENGITLNLKEFNKLELAIKRRIIMYAISEVIGNKNGIEKIHIDDIIKLCSNNIGNKFLTPKKNVKILIKNKQIYILKNN